MLTAGLPTQPQRLVVRETTDALALPWACPLPILDLHRKRHLAPALSTHLTLPSVRISPRCCPLHYSNTHTYRVPYWHLASERAPYPALEPVAALPSSAALSRGLAPPSPPPTWEMQPASMDDAHAAMPYSAWPPRSSFWLVADATPKAPGPSDLHPGADHHPW